MTREQLVELSRHRRQMQTVGGVWHDAVPWEFVERLFALAAPAQAEPAAPLEGRLLILDVDAAAKMLTSPGMRSLLEEGNDSTRAAWIAQAWDLIASLPASSPAAPEDCCPQCGGGNDRPCSCQSVRP